MALKSINTVSINSKVVNTLKKKQYQNFMYRAANTRFVFAKQDFLEAFDNHIVTKELQDGPKSENSQLIDHGNLYSFIGFNEGENPTAELREFLRENIYLDNNPKIKSTKNKIIYDFPINIPSKIQLYENFPTPDNWSSKSWLQLIEGGISNAAYYIFRLIGFATSRSGTGLQNKYKRKSGGSFKPTKYISELIDNFRKKFK